LGRKIARRVPSVKPAEPEGQSRQDGLPWLEYVQVAVALCAITLLAYSNSFRSGFVFDNQPLILQDPRLSQATAENVGLILQHSYWWPKGESGLYRPITTLSYLFNYAVLDESNHPAGYHWFNFFLHALNVLLLFVLSLRFLKKLWPAAFVAGLWAVHPVLTESVTNIIGRSDLLAAACTISGFLFYLNSTESRGWRRLAWLTGLTVVTTVGVFSKESGVAILGVITLFELTWWKERRQLRGLMFGCAAIALPFLALLYQRSVVLAGSPTPQLLFLDNPLVGAHFLVGRLTAIAVMARYLWLLVWPARLSCDYSYSTILLAKGGLWGIEWLTVVAFIAIVSWQFVRNKLLFFFAVFGFIAFLPVSNLLFPIGTIMAERFLYLPAAGFAICLVLVIYGVGRRLGRPAIAPFMLCLIIVALGIRTWERNRDWRDDISLWTATVRTVPNSFKAHGALALALYQSDPTHSNIDRVIEEAEKSVAIVNSLPDALNAEDVYAAAGAFYVVKGSLLLQTRANGKTADPPGSVRAYERAQELLKRGVSIQKTFDQSFREAERARGKSDSEIPLSGSPILYANLAANSVRLGDETTAFDAASYGRLLDVQNRNNYQILGDILIDKGRKEDAAVVLVEGMIVSGDPDFLKRLRGLYSSGLDPKGCAIVPGASGEVLNTSCEPAHDEICVALNDLAGVYRRKLRFNLSEYTEKKGKELGCPSKP
jgi:hypothetical protein